MTPSVLWSLGSVSLISLVSLSGLVLLSMRSLMLRRFLLLIVSFSTGAMLGNVFLHLLPEVIEESSNVRASLLIVLSGILISFAIEKFIHWHHCHNTDCEEHVHPVGKLVLLGDSVHNIVDGALITAAYLVDIPLGIATTTAVILHEIPQEISDFSILLHSGYTRAKALLFNLGTALCALIGVGIVLVTADAVEGIEQILLPLTAGNFLYIAGSDLIPELHKDSEKITRAVVQLLLMIAGIALMWVISGQAH